MNSPLLRDFFRANTLPLPLPHLFHSTSTRWIGLDKAVVQPLKQVVRRSLIRGFKDDYYHVDADVVLLEGEIHVRTKPVSTTVQLLHTYMVSANALHSSERGACSSRKINHALNTQVWPFMHSYHPRQSWPSVKYLLRACAN